MPCLQADYTLRRLQQLKERILGTESLVAIELDSRRNELVALNLVSCSVRAWLDNGWRLGRVCHLMSIAMLLCGILSRFLKRSTKASKRDVLLHACEMTLLSWTS